MKLPSYNFIRRAAQRHDLARLNLTADQLASIQGRHGRTGLHEAAVYGCLDQIVEGATAGQLDAVLDDYRTSALYPAIVNGHIGQIEGGVTVAELAAAKPIADFSIGVVSGTAAELSELSDREFQKRAARMSTSSTDIPQKTALHWLASRSGFKLIKGGATFEQLAGRFDEDGFSVLGLAAESGNLQDITGGVTAGQLASEKDRDGATPLHAAARSGHLNQIKGGVTVEQLAGVKDNNGLTPLHLAAIFNSLDQVTGVVTAKMLGAIRTHDGYTGLHVAASYRHIKGGVTVEELTGSVTKNGHSALVGAAVFLCLNKVVGGVTFEQLAAAKDALGNPGIVAAALVGSFDQLKGGASITQLASIRDEHGTTALEVAVRRGHVRKIFGSDPAKFWNGLSASEQALLQQAMKDQVVPKDLAGLAGNGIPVLEISFKDGIAEGSNILFDRSSTGTLAATRQFEKLELNFPLPKKLVCQRCHQESQVMIMERNACRHYCPACGAVHLFDAGAYEQEAVKCIKSMRRVFPWTVQFTCKCGTGCTHEFKNRVEKKVACHQCGETYRFAFDEEDQACFEVVKSQFADGQDPAGWTLLDSGPETLAA
jgi:ankyrin repeat protein